jgi:hypothetical protein
LTTCKTCGTDLKQTPPARHMTRTAKPEYRDRVCWVCARLLVSALREAAEFHAQAVAAGTD